MSQSNELITVVVPVYNKENFILQTLESIRKQTYKNLEIFVIDDCSTDDSYSICASFSKLDPRFHILRNQKNEGPSKTRNKGIVLAKGEFISFIDADDYIDPQFYETMINEIKCCDVAMCMADRVYESGQNRIFPYHFNTSGMYAGNQFWENFEYILSSANWNKLYRTRIIKKSEFKEIVGPEDLLFNIENIAPDTSICSINRILYHYRKTSNSLSSSFGYKEQKKDLDCFIILIKKLQKYGFRRNRRLLSLSISLFHKIESNHNFSKEEKRTNKNRILELICNEDMGFLSKLKLKFLVFF